jgi:hypothetical protein
MEPEGTMPSFITACVVAIVLAVGAAIVLDRVQEPATQAYASPSGVRI